jgi:hypothetical protein
MCSIARCLPWQTRVCNSTGSWNFQRSAMWNHQHKDLRSGYYVKGTTFEQPLNNLNNHEQPLQDLVNLSFILFTIFFNVTLHLHYDFLNSPKFRSRILLESINETFVSLRIWFLRDIFLPSFFNPIYSVSGRYQNKRYSVSRQLCAVGSFRAVSV